MTDPSPKDRARALALPGQRPPAEPDDYFEIKRPKLVAEDDQGYETGRTEAQIQTAAETLALASRERYGQTSENLPESEAAMSTTRSKTRPRTLSDVMSAMPVTPDVGMMQTVIQANNQAAEAWFDGWRQLLDNAAEFTSRRVNRDLEAVDALFSCKTPIEALRVQTEFLRTAFQDYLQELARLGEIETEAGAASIEALQRSVRDVETKGSEAAE
ncbi:MAG TPA: phasin family protein [Gammaproteobacteria bacterium]|nr:phasin family protein [Gammaproteobacteria bacterium]